MTMADIRLGNTCGVDLGERPWWMSPWQYDPCGCDLPKGHDGDHECEHTRERIAMNEYCCIPECPKRAIYTEVLGSVTYASSRLTTYVDLCEEHAPRDIPADVKIRVRALISRVS